MKAILCFKKGQMSICHTLWHYVTLQTTPKCLPQQPALDLGSYSIANHLLMLTHFQTSSYIK